MMRKIKSYFICIFILLSLFITSAYAESLYEYYFYPGETEKKEDIVIDEYDSFLNSLPYEVREQFPNDLFNNDENILSKSKEITDFNLIWYKFITAVTNVLFPSVKTSALIIGIILISALIRHFKKNITDKDTDKLTNSVINAGIILSIISTDAISIDTVDNFKNLLCNIMDGIIPVFGAVYATSGNSGTAAIQSGGIMLLVTICQNLFAVILIPSIRICLLMSIAHAVFPESGIKTVSSTFKTITIWIITVCVTLFSFVLGMQNTIAQSVDSFGMRSIKFAVGNLVPIIGGAVSDSLGTLGGSLSILKNAGGTVTIVIIVLLLLPTMAQLISRRIALFLCKSIAGILGCTTEEKLLEDIGGCVSMMIAFCVALSVAFIYVLTLFTGSTLAITS